MSTGRETTFQKRVLSDLASLPHCEAIKVSQRSKRGDADVVGCLSGHFFALELKADEYEQADLLQLHKLSRWRRAGGVAYVAFPGNWPGVLEELKRKCQRKLLEQKNFGEKSGGS